MSETRTGRRCSCSHWPCFLLSGKSRNDRNRHPCLSRRGTPLRLGESASCSAIPGEGNRSGLARCEPVSRTNSHPPPSWREKSHHGPPQEYFEVEEGGAGEKPPAPLRWSGPHICSKWRERLLRGRVKDTNLVTCQNPWELSTLMWSSFANDLEYLPLSRGVHEAQD